MGGSDSLCARRNGARVSFVVAFCDGILRLRPPGRAESATQTPTTVSITPLFDMRGASDNLAQRDTLTD
jgi:hypothetical protein